MLQQERQLRRVPDCLVRGLIIAAAFVVGLNIAEVFGELGCSVTFSSQIMQKKDHMFLQANGNMQLWHQNGAYINCPGNPNQLTSEVLNADF